jgi:hypothetical protein
MSFAEELAAAAEEAERDLEEALSVRDDEYELLAQLHVLAIGGAGLGGGRRGGAA